MRYITLTTAEFEKIEGKAKALDENRVFVEPCYMMGREHGKVLCGVTKDATNVIEALRADNRRLLVDNVELQSKVMDLESQLKKKKWF